MVETHRYKNETVCLCNETKGNENNPIKNERYKYETLYLRNETKRNENRTKQ